MRRKNSVLSLHKSCSIVSIQDLTIIELSNDTFLHRAPEMFDIIPKSVNTTTAKKNLAQIAKVLGQITSGTEFGDDKPSYIPINDFVRNAIGQLTSWFMQGMSSDLKCNILEFNLVSVADVPDAERQFHAHEFMDATVQPKSIYISPNEIYTTHSLLIQQQDYLVSEMSTFCKSCLDISRRRRLQMIP